MVIKHKTNTKHIKSYTNSYLHFKLATKSIIFQCFLLSTEMTILQSPLYKQPLPISTPFIATFQLRILVLEKFKMAKLVSFVFVLSLLAFAPLCFCGRNNGGFGSLYPQYYDHSCPKAKEIVKSIMAKAFAREARIAASILRLHFHDCFVQVNFTSLLLSFLTLCFIIKFIVTCLLKLFKRFE